MPSSTLFAAANRVRGYLDEPARPCDAVVKYGGDEARRRGEAPHRGSTTSPERNSGPGYGLPDLRDGDQSPLTRRARHEPAFAAFRRRFRAHNSEVATGVAFSTPRPIC
jgi:hypothetical protein